MKIYSHLHANYLDKKFTKEEYLTSCSALGYSVTEGFVKHLEKKEIISDKA